jgi:hypothetical protein
MSIRQLPDLVCTSQASSLRRNPCAGNDGEGGGAGVREQGGSAYRPLHILRAHTPRDLDDQEDYGAVTAASPTPDHVCQRDIFSLSLRECPALDGIV